MAFKAADGFGPADHAPQQPGFGATAYTARNGNAARRSARLASPLMDGPSITSLLTAGPVELVIGIGWIVVTVYYLRIYIVSKHQSVNRYYRNSGPSLSIQGWGSFCWAVALRRVQRASLSVYRNSME